MMKISLSLLLAVFILGSLTTPLLGAPPPSVVAASPDHGETVPSNLKKIRLEFDRNMAGGVSFMRWRGLPFPKAQGQPRWITPRICEFAIALKPDTIYGFCLNSPRQGQGKFMSKEGERLPWYPIVFRTAGETSAKPLTRQQNRESLKVFREAIAHRYSHRDRVVKDWDALFEKYQDELLAADTPFRFAALAGRLLASAEDLHVVTKAEGFTFTSTARDLPPDWNFAAFAGTMKDFKQRSNECFSGRIVQRGLPEPGVGYICIASWEKEKEAAIRPAFAALDELMGCPNLIIDIRPNSGGSEFIARQFAGRFITQPVVYAKHLWIEPGAKNPGLPEGFTGPHERTLQPNKHGKPYPGRVFVLMGRHCMSSAEGFLQMMQQAPKATLIGRPSWGCGGNPGPVELPNGVTLMLSRWRALTLEGAYYEGKGLTPDVTVACTEADFQKNDPILKRALNLIIMSSGPG